jgi:phenylacetate-coenzyme A ligase PaaK-like adenylate-forming protein
MRFVMRWARRTGAFRGRPATVMIGAPPGAHGSHLLGRLFAGDAFPRLSVLDPIGDVVAALNAAEPEHLIAYASFLARLVEDARGGRLRIRPKLVSPVAEPFLPDQERDILEVWGATVLGGWAATETGGLASGSGFEPGMLLHDDLVIVEPVDADGAPVPAGTPAEKVFVTPLRPSALPLLRYELTDQLTVHAERAVCGSSFTRVSNVVGRLDDQFVYASGVVVHPQIFRGPLMRHGVAEYQVEQTPRGAVIRVVSDACPDGGPERARVAREISDHLAGLGVTDPEVRVEAIPVLALTRASGKLRRFVPLESLKSAPAMDGGRDRAAGADDA